MTKRLLFIALNFWVLGIHAEIKMPRIFGDNMVLQRNKSVAIWGNAAAKSIVTVMFRNTEVNTETNNDGKWILNIPIKDAGGPFEFTARELVDGKLSSELKFKNVMVGDVWLASGQSNMEWRVKESKDADNEIAKANYPNIHFFQVPHDIKTEKQTDFASGDWTECTPNVVAELSAAAYFFARKIHTQENIPIGIIQSTWGGTPVEAWTSTEMLNSFPETRAQIADNIAKNINQKTIDNNNQQNKFLWDVVTSSVKGIDCTKSTFDDSKWSTIAMPGLFRNAQKEKYEGIVWTRKTIDLPESFAGKDLQINLAYPEMMYFLYFNETEICRMKWNAEKRHVYTIPGKLVKKGTNTIVLRIAVLWGGGGINPPADSFYLSCGREKVSMAGNWTYMKGLEPQLPVIYNYHYYPGYVYNAMLNPLLPYGITGCIWYQGEANAAAAKQYQTLFPLMINDWRIRFQQGNFPFIYVQLANYMKRHNAPTESQWAELREAQTLTLNYPNTAMATIIDIGDGDNIHPQNKQDVGYRLSLAAGKLVYGRTDEYSGPVCDSFKIEGNSIRVYFSHVANGLCAKDNKTLTGFAIAGADKKFEWAVAEIMGNSVLVKSDKVPEPKFVRYAWADNPDCNLYNSAGLPTVPFRTDQSEIK